ncbi:MAG: cytosine permease [Sedimentisphaerales bacterium]|nr:cytosine permease [Sedimentisphaerales bacterium]
MSQNDLPGYLKSAKANPAGNRAPWYKNTAPSYAGIFLSVPFMAGMAGALQYGSLWAGVVGLIIGALFCFVLYYVPALLGLRTGMPLYVVGSSTFGTHGGILMPGLLMGVLQIGWHAVFTFTAATFFMSAINSSAQANPTLFWGVCVVWGMIMALVGAVGIGWLAWLSSWVPIFPLLIIIIAAFSNMSGLSKFNMSVALPTASAGLIPLLGLGAFAALQSAAGFFATAGAAGADFAMNSRNEKDVVYGGFFGITLVAFVAGLFALLTIAGAIGNNPEIAVNAHMQTPQFFEDPSIAFRLSIGAVGGNIAKVMFWVFVIACICPTGFCAFLAGNAFSTMFPKLPRVGLTLVAGLIGVILAGTGVASKLIGFFLIIGASFGPIIGAMTAEFIRHGKWCGPRKGINWAGYIAWALGFAVGILGVIPGIGFAYGLETLMSFIVGLAAYMILAEMGLEPEVVELPAE